MFGSQRNVSDGGRGVELHKRPEKRGVCSVAAEYTTEYAGGCTHEIPGKCSNPHQAT